MTYLLDTNACIDLLQHGNGPIAQRLALLPAREIALCSVVKMELRYGAERSSRRDDNLQLLARFFSQFASFPFDDQAAETAGQLRAHLAALGTPIGPNDLLIASIALANGLMLVTHNTREFGRVPGLNLEDWESTPETIGHRLRILADCQMGQRHPSPAAFREKSSLRWVAVKAHVVAVGSLTIAMASLRFHQPPLISG